MSEVYIMGIVVFCFSILIYLIMTSMESSCDVKTTIPLYIAIAFLLFGFYCTFFA